MAKSILPMTAERMRECIKKLGMTQPGLGRLININERTVRRMTSGEQPVVNSLALLLEVMVRGNISVRKFLKLIGDDRDPAMFGDTRPDQFFGDDDERRRPR